MLETITGALPNADAEIEPVPTSGGGRIAEPEMDRLSNIARTVNDQFGGPFANTKRMEKRITGEIPSKVSAYLARTRNPIAISGNASTPVSLAANRAHRQFVSFGDWRKMTCQ